MTELYWGGTLDANCEDKEGAWAGVQGFLALYELTQEHKHLDWAAHAMDVTLSYYLGREDLKRLAVVMFRSCGRMIDPFFDFFWSMSRPFSRGLRD